MEDMEQPDLKTPEGIERFMRGSKSEEQWNRNCDAVKKAYNGQYPDFWYKTIIMSGVAREVSDSWSK